MWKPGDRLAVFSIKGNRGGTVWLRAGTAFVNKDGSLNLLLDVLPIDGRLHVREVLERRDSAKTSEAATQDTRTFVLANAPEPGAAVAS